MPELKMDKVLSVVSLFTREWIEICTLSLIAVQISGLPLYEGVD